MISENYVIGIIAKHPHNLDIARGILSSEDFQQVEAACCWLAMIEIADKHNMPPMHGFVKEMLDEQYHYFLDQCVSNVYTDANIDFYCKDVLSKAKEKRLIDAVRTIDLTDNPAEHLEKALTDYRDIRGSSSQTFRELITKTVDYIETASEGGNGIKTGIGGIDRQMGGLQNQRVMIIAARTSVGKTALANQIALHTAKQNIPTGVCSLEMGDAELGIRAIAHTCKTSIGGLFRADNYALEDMSKGMAVNGMVNWPLYFNTDSYRLEEIVSQIKLWAFRDDIKVIMVDHIGLIEKTANSRNEALGMITRAFKKLSKELNLPIILVCQLNRSNDKENRRPRLSDLRDSGNIEQDADIVLLLHKVADTNGSEFHEFIMAKNRQGPTGVIGSRFEFDGITQTFNEVASYSQEL